VDVRVSATLDLLDLERNHIDVSVRFFPIREGMVDYCSRRRVPGVRAPVVNNRANR